MSSHRRNGGSRRGRVTFRSVQTCMRDPRSRKTPYAVVQLRKENVEGTASSIRGESMNVLRCITPRCSHSAFCSPGSFRTPLLRRPRQTRLKTGTDALYFAGQIAGAEDYVEAAACGAMTGTHAARQIGPTLIEFPSESAFGVVAHLQNMQTPDFQPDNVTWGPFRPLDAIIKDKKARRRAMARTRARPSKTF